LDLIQEDSRIFTYIPITMQESYYEPPRGQEKRFEVLYKVTGSLRNRK